MVAERACVLIGACRSPAFARAIGRLCTLSEGAEEGSYVGLREDIGAY